MSANSPFYRSPRLLFFGGLFVIVALLMSSSMSSTTHGAGAVVQKKPQRGDILVSKPEEIAPRGGTPCPPEAPWPKPREFIIPT